MCRAVVVNVENITTSKPTISIEPYIQQFRAWVDLCKLERKQHQVDGVRWCLIKELNTTPRGGIIADEMGLGKTVQAIGLMVANIKRRTLIVLPPILIEQWREAIYKLTGYPPLVYHGANIKTTSDAEIIKARVVITSYAHIASGNKRGRGIISEVNRNVIHTIKWSRIIYDEAHHMRNRKTKTFIGASALSTKITWIITGTPIHNKIDDIYAYLQLIGLNIDHIKRPALNLAIKTYVLMRTKADANLKLPTIRDNTIMVKWNCPVERRFAYGLHGTTMEDREDNLEIDYISQSMTQGHIFRRIMRARQCCVSNALFVNAIVSTSANEEVLHQIVNGMSKLNDVVRVMTERKSNGRKKLVFCTFKKEIDMLAQLLSLTLKVSIFDGRIPQRERNAILSPTTDNDVLIMQIQTGCEGLNLQQYKEVYFVSAHWNPAVEDQAIARCHRIGQADEVDVFRFIMTDFSEEVETYDTKIIRVQKKKRHLRLIISDPDGFIQQ